MAALEEDLNKRYDPLKIYKSTDYDQFIFLDDNRGVLRGHVASLAEEGNTTAVEPITVNERFEVIDGQHRVTACRENGWPVYFKMREGLTISDARKMNILHRTWTADDFARSYAAGGNTHYRKFLELREDYGFTHTITLYTVYGGDKKGLSKQFRTGEFKIEDEAATRARLDKLGEMVEVMNVKPSEHFFTAYLAIMKVNGFDHRRMVRKTQAAGDQVLRRFGSMPDYFRALEEVYNYAMPESNRLRLY